MKEGNIFFELETFIRKSLHPKQIESSHLQGSTNDPVKAFNEVVDQNTHKIHEAIFNIRKEKELRVFIYHCQVAVTGIANTIYRYRLESTAKVSVAIYNRIIDRIEQELTYIEQNFPDYINAEGLLPLYRAENLRFLFKQKEQVIFSFFKTHNAGNELTSTIKSQVEQAKKFIILKQLTFHQFNYCNYFINNILDDDNIYFNGNEFSFDSAVQFLIRINFNYSGVFQYLVNELQQKISLNSEADERINTTLICIKHLQQLNIFDRVALYPSMPSLKKQLLIWLQEELYFLERSQKRLVETQLIEKKNGPSESAKLHTRLSVDQLGIIFRAAADTGLIEKKSYKSLFEKLAPFLSTPYTKNISPDSLRSKAYAAENRDKQVVKDMLMELYKKINFY